MKQIVTAKTVAEAKARAAQLFSVPEERITFNVLEEPKKGLFGMRGEAKLEAEFEPTKAETARNYIIGVMTAMGYENPEVSIEESENSAVLEISGEGADKIIGRRGETIDALQYLASLACNKHDKEFYRITVDCDGFRERRKAQLQDLARKMAEKAKRTGRSVSLEPMNPYERRIIHAAVAELENCTSRSVGEEPYRKVLISSTERKPYASKDGERPARGERRPGGRNDRNGRRNGRRREDFKAKSLDITSSFEKDYKKPKPEDEIGSGLYSKIEF